MPDIIAEIRAAIVAAARQMVAAEAAQRGWENQAAVLNAHNPMGATEEATFAADFATGYSGGVTIVPFTFDLSAFDGSDVLL